jgi:hypothetical protein
MQRQHDAIPHNLRSSAEFSSSMRKLRRRWVALLVIFNPATSGKDSP